MESVSSLSPPRLTTPSLAVSWARRHHIDLMICRVTIGPGHSAAASRDLQCRRGTPCYYHLSGRSPCPGRNRLPPHAVWAPRGSGARHSDLGPGGKREDIPAAFVDPGGGPGGEHGMGVGTGGGA